MKKVVIFTANTSGGIIQFASQASRVMIALDYEVWTFLPQNYEGDDFLKTFEGVIKYTKVQTINSKSLAVNKIVDEICSYRPKITWFVDSSILTCQVAEGLINRGIHPIITFHDATSYHPTNQGSFKVIIKNKIHDHLVNKVIKAGAENLLLSKESKDKFEEKYPMYKKHTYMMNLGAHIPVAEETKPEGLSENEISYLLFFGRIDKYKGLETLFEAYIQAKQKGYSNRLIVAGNGKMTEKEQQLSIQAGAVVLNRYINDSEMLWLFQNAKVLVLPYIEATQSGIIPIAYYYGKPVIVSDVPGLTQYVIDHVTGYICSDADEFSETFFELEDANYEKMSGACKKYEEDNFDWAKNIRKLIAEIGKSE